jgi:hypothetical protein
VYIIPRVNPAQAENLSFDAASVAVKNSKTGDVERVDLPMRASAGGYYANLMQMYNHLGVPLHPIRFLFVFAEALSRSQRLPASTANGAKVNPPLNNKPDAEADTTGGFLRRYFIHASNLHQTPPPWPGNRGVVPHIVEVMYLIVCHFWFSLACFAILPITSSANSSRSDGGETFGEYLERIWLPRRYASQYLLPLMSSVSTCTHDEMLNFPASDIVNYKKLSHGQHHYAVCGGVSQVQSKLSKGMDDVRLGARVLEVTAPNTDDGTAVSIRWQSTKDTSGEVSEESFDRVVLAVSPDVAAKIFKPLQSIADTIPTVQVESSVLVPAAAKETYSVMNEHDQTASGCMHHGKNGTAAQTITFKTKFLSSKGSRTEALHSMPSGVVVSTCPLDSPTHPKNMLQHAQFTRTLRTPESRAAVERIMGRATDVDDKTQDEDEWVNGDDNVWLAGAWCWDGMVLLEGCIVSAMQVADDFGVRVPWRTSAVAER